MLKSKFAFFGLIFGMSMTYAAHGEMGTGIPRFGVYTAGTGGSISVGILEDATVPFPAGCVRLIPTPTTMGMDSYKIAVATLLTATASGRRVRFYAHAVRDDGCGVDYVELL